MKAASVHEMRRREMAMIAATARLGQLELEALIEGEAVAEARPMRYHLEDLSKLATSAGVHVEAGRLEEGLRDNLRFVATWLVGLPVHSEYDHDLRLEAIGSLGKALEQVSVLRSALLRRWTTEAVEGAASYENGAIVPTRLRLLRNDLTTKRLGLLEGAIAPAQDAVKRLLVKLDKAHKRKNGMQAATGTATITFTMTGLTMAAVTMGPVGAIVGPVTVAVLSAGIGVANVVVARLLRNESERAKALLADQLRVLGLLTPALLLNAQAMAAEILEEWAELDPSEAELVSTAASWRYVWWTQAADEAADRWKAATVGKGSVWSEDGGQGLLRTGVGNMAEVGAMGLTVNKYEHFVHDDYEEGDENRHAWELTNIAAKTLAVALQMYNVGTAVAALRRGETEGKGFLRTWTQVERLHAYTKAVSAAYAAKLDGSSEGRELELAVGILEAQFRCSACGLVRPPIACRSCGLWTRCIDCSRKLPNHVCPVITPFRGSLEEEDEPTFEETFAFYASAKEKLKKEQEAKDNSFSPIAQNLLERFLADFRRERKLKAGKAESMESLVTREEGGFNNDGYQNVYPLLVEGDDVKVANGTSKKAKNMTDEEEVEEIFRRMEMEDEAKKKKEKKHSDCAIM